MNAIGVHRLPSGQPSMPSLMQNWVQCPAGNPSSSVKQRGASGGHSESTVHGRPAVRGTETTLSISIMALSVGVNEIPESMAPGASEAQATSNHGAAKMLIIERTIMQAEDLLPGTANVRHPTGLALPVRPQLR